MFLTVMILSFSGIKTKANTTPFDTFPPVYNENIHNYFIAKPIKYSAYSGNWTYIVYDKNAQLTTTTEPNGHIRFEANNGSTLYNGIWYSNEWTSGTEKNSYVIDIDASYDYYSSKQITGTHVFQLAPLFRKTIMEITEQEMGALMNSMNKDFGILLPIGLVVLSLLLLPTLLVRLVRRFSV